MRAIVRVEMGIPSNLQISSVLIKGSRLTCKRIYCLSASERISGRPMQGELVPVVEDWYIAMVV